MKKKEGTKLCKYCKTEIPIDAKVCPQCRKKQKGGKLKWILILVIVIIAIAALAGGGSDDETASESDTSQEESGETIIKVGESFENNGLKVTVDSYNDDFTDYSEYSTPGDGNKYIEVGFTYENVGDDGDKYVSIYDCNCFADNTAYEQVYIGDEDFINENLSSGRNVNFKVYYEVPIDSSEIELEYDTSFWDSEKVVIKLQ